MIAGTLAFTGAAGNRLVASVFGEGPRSVLLLHGGGQTRHAWEETAKRLAAEGWRALCLDQRGHGDSERAPDGAYSFLAFAADAAHVGRSLAREGDVPVAIGASLGGIASLLALGETPAGADAPFRGLVLVDIVPRMDPRGVDKIQGFMRAHAREGFASIEAAADAVAAYLPHRPRPRSLDGLRKNLRLSEDGRWRWHWDPAFLDGPASVNADWEHAEARLHHATRTLCVPTLLVRGGSSELVTPEAAKDFLAMAPDAEFVDVAEARHMVAGDANDVFADAVTGFLARRLG
ncbi:alpha/beta fold hydrolase [Salinarimonas ramus]|uniref:Peroxidase n=1 Tax=Salinarimonas ramus TaxID=690164 RepID=A0A917QGW5_9HYPH|nr:alpha/beta hydrolase [Salinarimonas ramus]GGK50005.1 peroxidase [Salinarimonas ramus]